MIDKNLILNNPESFLTSLKRKTEDLKTLSAAQELISLIKSRKEKTTSLDAIKALFNSETEAFHKSAKSLTPDEVLEKRSALSLKKEEIKEESVKLESLLQREESLLLEIPNLPSDSAPEGKSDSNYPGIR